MSNQYTYKPPCTTEQLYEAYCIDGMSQDEIAKKFETTQKVIWRAMKKAGIKTRPAKARDQFGEKNQNWKGGRVLMAKVGKKGPFSDRGYWYVYKPNHPHANKSGYVAEHIVVATEQAGRMLQTGEQVHHKDLDKHNNDPKNLIIANRKKHRSYHLQLELIAVELYRNGLIVFEDNHYQSSNELQEVLNACK